MKHIKLLIALVAVLLLVGIPLTASALDAGADDADATGPGTGTTPDGAAAYTQALLDAMGRTPLIRLNKIVEPDMAQILVKFEGVNVAGRSRRAPRP